MHQVHCIRDLVLQGPPSKRHRRTRPAPRLLQQPQRGVVLDRPWHRLVNHAVPKLLGPEPGRGRLHFCSQVAHAGPAEAQLVPSRLAEAASRPVICSNATWQLKAGPPLSPDTPRARTGTAGRPSRRGRSTTSQPQARAGPACSCSPEPPSRPAAPCQSSRRRSPSPGSRTEAQVW